MERIDQKSGSLFPDRTYWISYQSYFLKVIIYTGKHTYVESANQTEKKAVQIVKQLCKCFEGSHQTVYVDRFYTSINLMKELQSICNWYVDAESHTIGVDNWKNNKEVQRDAMR